MNTADAKWLADIGQARAAISHAQLEVLDAELRELRAMRARCNRQAQLLLDVAARCMMLAAELAPDMPGITPPSEGRVK